MPQTIRHFLASDSGAVTVEWVGLMAGAVGLGLVVMTTVSGSITEGAASMIASLSGGSGGESASLTTPFNGTTATDYLHQGQALAPGNNGAAYGWATQQIVNDAPAGYNFNHPLADPATGNAIYTSNDGANYSIGGQVIPVSQYTGTANYFGA